MCLSNLHKTFTHWPILTKNAKTYPYIFIKRDKNVTVHSKPCTEDLPNCTARTHLLFISVALCPEGKGLEWWADQEFRRLPPCVPPPPPHAADGVQPHRATRRSGLSLFQACAPVQPPRRYLPSLGGGGGGGIGRQRCAGKPPAPLGLRRRAVATCGVAGGGGGGGMTSRFECTRWSVILTPSQAHSVLSVSRAALPALTRTVPNGASSSLQRCRIRMLRGLSGSAHPPPTAPVSHGIAASGTLERVDIGRCAAPRH